ncbi:MAG: hypothetical protein QXW80_03060 [Candidatus Micrarchaeia archaeon]|uniref:hypothetical protein n=1 Tax=Saccharolobus sp. TaxID=2100761 RepID=UPI0031778F8E
MHTLQSSQTHLNNFSLDVFPYSNRLKSLFLEEPIIDCLKLLNFQYIDLTSVYNNKNLNISNIPDVIVQNKVLEFKNWNNHYKITKYLVINEILPRFNNYLDRDKILIISNPNWDVGSKELLLDHGIKVFELDYFVSRDIWLNHYSELVYHLLFIVSKIFKIPLTHEDAIRLIKDHLGHLYDIPKYWDNVGKNDSESGSKEESKSSGYLDINKAIGSYLDCVSIRECFRSAVPRVFSRFKLWLWMVKSRLRSVLYKLKFKENCQNGRVEPQDKTETFKYNGIQLYKVDPTKVDILVGIEVWNFEQPHKYSARMESILEKLKPFKHRGIIVSYMDDDTKKRIEDYFLDNKIKVKVVGFEFGMDISKKRRRLFDNILRSFITELLGEDYDTLQIVKTIAELSSKLDLNNVTVHPSIMIFTHYTPECYLEIDDCSKCSNRDNCNWFKHRQNKFVSIDRHFYIDVSGSDIE